MHHFVVQSQINSQETSILQYVWWVICTSLHPAHINTQEWVCLWLCLLTRCLAGWWNVHWRCMQWMDWALYSEHFSKQPWHSRFSQILLPSPSSNPQLPRRFPSITFSQASFSHNVPRHAVLWQCNPSLPRQEDSWTTSCLTSLPSFTPISRERYHWRQSAEEEQHKVSNVHGW